MEIATPRPRALRLSESLAALVVLLIALGAGGCSALGANASECGDCNPNRTGGYAYCEGNTMVSKLVYDDCPDSCTPVVRTPCGTNEVCVDLRHPVCEPRCTTKADCPAEAPHCNHDQGELVCGAPECFANEDCAAPGTTCSWDGYAGTFSCVAALHAGDSCAPSSSASNEPCAPPLHCLRSASGSADSTCQ